MKFVEAVCHSITPYRDTETEIGTKRACFPLLCAKGVVSSTGAQKNKRNFEMRTIDFGGGKEMPDVGVRGGIKFFFKHSLNLEKLVHGGFVWGE